MSGDPLAILPGPIMARLVGAAAKVAASSLTSYAVIGGVAVAARLRQSHRATADLDAVVDDRTPPPALRTLLSLPGARADPGSVHRVLIDGIKVEIQYTEPFDPSDLQGLTEQQVLYVGAHRLALESAKPVTLLAEADGQRATIPVATPGALVAMKLHAIGDRRPRGALDKRASDAWDLYRLLLDLDRSGAVRDELIAVPSLLRTVVAEAAERFLVTGATRTASWLRSGDDRMAAIGADELRALGTPLVDAVRPD